MDVIYKYEIEVTDYPRVRVPVDAEVLDIQVQNGALFLWARHTKNDSYDVEEKEIQLRIVGTGNPVNNVGEYIKTVQMPPFVWHIFHAKEK